MQRASLAAPQACRRGFDVSPCLDAPRRAIRSAVPYAATSATSVMHWLVGTSPCRLSTEPSTPAIWGGRERRAHRDRAPLTAATWLPPEATTKPGLLRHGERR